MDEDGERPGAVLFVDERGLVVRRADGSEVTIAEPSRATGAASFFEAARIVGARGLRGVAEVLERYACKLAGEGDDGDDDDGDGAPELRHRRR